MLSSMYGSGLDENNPPAVFSLADDTKTQLTFYSQSTLFMPLIIEVKKNKQWTLVNPSIKTCLTMASAGNIVFMLSLSQDKSCYKSTDL